VTVFARHVTWCRSTDRTDFATVRVYAMLTPISASNASANPE